MFLCPECKAKGIKSEVKVVQDGFKLNANKSWSMDENGLFMLFVCENENCSYEPLLSISMAELFTMVGMDGVNEFYTDKQLFIDLSDEVKDFVLESKFYAIDFDGYVNDIDGKYVSATLLEKECMNERRNE